MHSTSRAERGEAMNGFMGSIHTGNAGGKLTIAHVTHEAVDHLGGIGTVLAGLMTSKTYLASVERSILVGPLPWPHSRVSDPKQRLGASASECLYSGPDQYDPKGYGSILKPIEWAFGTPIVLGRRVFHPPGGAAAEGDEAHADVLLIDVSNPNAERLGALKWMLFQKFGIDSRKYESGWDYEEYCRLADPAYHALCALLGERRTPAVLIAHEFMGLCTALRASLDRPRFRTLFHAHECSTARRVTENLPGYDAAFYPAMRAARAKGMFIQDVFGDQSDFSRHALVSQAHRLDGTLAVGPETAEELAFLSPEMSRSNIRVAYNGLPARAVTLEQRRRSRGLVNQWLRNTIGFVPDYLFTHVTRPVPSKGLWRDLKVAQHLEPMLARAGKTAAYVLLTCGANARSREQVEMMSREYHWPVRHREGFPDLVGPEVHLHQAMMMFQQHTHTAGGRTRRAGQQETGGGRGGITSGGVATIAQTDAEGRWTPIVPLLVNQFGFSRERLGDAAPAEMTTEDLRRAADAEFGLSTYEPFGIAQLEPLHAGAVCLPSSVCGCQGLVKRAMDELKLDEARCPIVLTGDFTRGVWTGAAGASDTDISATVRMSAHDRHVLEDRECSRLAEALFNRLPRSEVEEAEYLKLGQALAQRMSWDRVVETDFLPGVREAMGRA